MLTSGHILAVQERRFRLITSDGQVYLLTLGVDATVDEMALHDFRDRHAAVEVDFSGEPNLVGGVAHAVRLANDNRTASRAR
ncbi:MAG TPA: hypothetical protein VGQ62_21895 [Chloroflexota bacterium]|jgi:hypothetical protein|nr:hypothetical protein [Chloroflexota bacterium]